MTSASPPAAIPPSGAYTNVTVDAIVEVDASGAVVWEWCFFDHGIQDFDATKSNYVGAGKSISNYVGRLNLNLPGRPLTNDWLHCNSIDYNTNLDQIVITAEGGEFYVIDHGNTFVAGNPAASIALAASTNGDFLYRFGDPARYSQGSPPSIQQNWSVSSTGNKQIGAVSQAQWIPTGVPGAGHFLVFNNGGDLFESTPQSYLFEVNGYLNASGTDTGAYVNPPAAGYNIWSAPGHDTDKQRKTMSRQIVSMFYSMANQGFFSHLGGSAQRLPNSNTLVCAATEGHIFEVTAAGEAVWEYINPITSTGVVAYKRDNWPLDNAVYRATRYSATHPALAGRTLIGTNTITGAAPSYISAPTISGTTQIPTAPYSTNTVLVTATVTNSQSCRVGDAGLHRRHDHQHDRHDEFRRGLRRVDSCLCRRHARPLLHQRPGRLRQHRHRHVAFLHGARGRDESSARDHQRHAVARHANQCRSRGGHGSGDGRRGRGVGHPYLQHRHRQRGDEYGVHGNDGDQRRQTVDGNRLRQRVDRDLHRQQSLRATLRRQLRHRQHQRTGVQGWHSQPCGFDGVTHGDDQRQRHGWFCGVLPDGEQPEWHRRLDLPAQQRRQASSPA